MTLKFKLFIIGVSVLFFLNTFNAWSMACDYGEHECDHERKTFVSTLPSSGKWKDKVTPKSLWKCQDVEDLGSANLLCQMCEREYVRYAHTMQHDNHENLTVGCICAGHMEGDLKSAKGRESYLHSRHQRRAKWLGSEWETSRNGNLYKKTRKNSHDEASHHIVMIKSKYNQHSAIIDSVRLERWFPTMAEAQYASFDYLWPAKKTF
jgi:hypothetical protein